MLVRGAWFLFPDGISRPVTEAGIQTASGIWQTVTFLLDAGADRTVLEARFLPLLSALALPLEESPALAGVGGKVGCSFVQTRLRFLSETGTYVFINGPFGVFTEPASSDVSVLGRDVTNNFDVIYSYPRNEVVLIAPPHGYSLV